MDPLLCLFKCSVPVLWGYYSTTVTFEVKSATYEGWTVISDVSTEKIIINFPVQNCVWLAL